MASRSHGHRVLMADSAIECREYSEEGAAAASRPSSDNRQQVVLQGTCRMDVSATVAEWSDLQW